MGRQVLVGGGLQVGLTVAVAALVAAALGLPWQVALFLGCLIALSSTALVLKGLTDKGEIDAPHGRLATGVLIFQDLCVVPIMLALPFLAGRATGGAAQLALALGNSRTHHRAPPARRDSENAQPGAFPDRDHPTGHPDGARHRGSRRLPRARRLPGGARDLGVRLRSPALAELLPFRDVFISLFFVAVGMLVQVHFIREHPVWTLGGVLLVLGGKTVVAAVGPALLGYAGRVA